MYTNYNTDLNKLQEKKRLSMSVAKKLYSAGLYRVSSNILNCANYAVRVTCPDCGETHHINLMYCRERLCPLCQYKRSLKIKHNTMDIVKRVEEVNTDIQYLFITLTMRNCYGDELQKAIDDELAAWAKLTDKRKRFKKVCRGYIRTLEVTYNAEKHSYHPHLHIIMAVSDDYFTNPNLYLTHNDIAEHWRTAMNLSYRPVIDVRAITKEGQKIIIDAGEDIREDIIIKKLDNRELQYEHAVSEVCKYAVKFNYEKAPAIALKTLYEALHGRRLISYGGIFRIAKQELQIPDEENVSPEEELTLLEDGLCESCAGSELMYELLRFDAGASMYSKIATVAEMPQIAQKTYYDIKGEYVYDDDLRE